jgi:hypothetical protein
MSYDFDPEEWIQRIREAMPRPFAQPGRADLVVRAVLALKPELWHTDDGEAFASISDADDKDADGTGPQRHYRIGSDEFTAVMLRAFEAVDPIWIDGPDGGSLQMPAHTESTVRSAKAVLKAMALSGRLRQPAVRVAMAGDAWWLDPGNASHQVVQITKKDWKIVDRCPAPFLRPEGMLAAAMPQRNPGSVAGEVAELFGLDGEQFMTLVCICLDALRPVGDHIVSVIDGEPGLGKTILCRFIRSLVDPHAADVEGLPDTERTLARQADSCRFLSYDNVTTKLTAQQQDWLCRLSTGFVFRVPRLYADRALTAFTWCGGVLLGGAPDFVGRSDVASRILRIWLDRPIERRLPREMLERRLAALRGRFLGYLLKGMVKALARKGEMADLPRLASPAYWCAAAAPAFGWTEDAVLTLFGNQEENAQRRVAASDPVAASILDMMLRGNLWRWPPPDMAMTETFGWLHQLYEELIDRNRSALHAKEFPKLSSELGGSLRSVKRPLAACGIAIEWHADNLRLSLTRRLTSVRP